MGRWAGRGGRARGHLVLDIPPGPAKRSYAKAKRTLEDIPITDLSYDDRRVLLQHAVLLSYIDGEQADAEKKLLEQLCQRLGIPGAESTALIQAAEERAKGLLDLL